MYILTGEKRYRCTGYRVSERGVWYGLPDNVPETLGEKVTLLDKCGFELSAQMVGDYLRWYTTERALVLTNTTEEEEIAQRTQAEQNVQLTGLLGGEKETVPTEG